MKKINKCTECEKIAPATCPLCLALYRMAEKVTFNLAKVIEGYKAEEARIDEIIDSARRDILESKNKRNESKTGDTQHK